MKEVICDIGHREEDLPVKVEIKKNFGIIPPLEGRKTIFLIKITKKEEELPGIIHCHLIAPKDEDIIHTEDFKRPFREKKVEIVFQYPGYHRWCCGSKMQSTYRDLPSSEYHQILNIVGYKSFRVYQIFEFIIAIIGAVLAVIAVFITAITGILTL